MSILSRLRLFWRDLLSAELNASNWIEENILGRFFLESGVQHIWSKPEVHETMMRDSIRVKAFEDAINETVENDDTVLDVGTGMGILSFLAARKAAKVIAIDSSDIIGEARKIAKENSVKNIEFIRTDVNDLNIDKVDCVIAELIGMGIIDEGVIEKTVKARKFLKEDGVLIPSVIEIYVAPIDSTDIGLGYWRQLYDIDYSSIDSQTLKTRNFDATEKTRMLAEPVKAFTLDLKTIKVENLEKEFEFTIQEDGLFTGCIMYFKLKLSENVVLDTTPGQPLTHWRHLYLPHTGRREVKKGEVIKASLKTRNKARKWLWKYNTVM